MSAPMVPGNPGFIPGSTRCDITPPAAQTGGERAALAQAKAVLALIVVSGESSPLTRDEARALLAALDRGAEDATKLANAEQMLTDYATELQKLRVRYEAAERTVAGLVEHKAVILNALLTLHPRNEAHRVRLDAAERAVVALPEQEVSNG